MRKNVKSPGIYSVEGRMIMLLQQMHVGFDVSNDAGTHARTHSPDRFYAVIQLVQALRLIEL